MPTATYETLFMLDATKVAADADAVKQQVHHLLERHGAQVIVSREWNYNQKLAYPVNKQKKAAFHIIYYMMESTHQAALERDIALADGIIHRQLTLKLDPKWQDTVLDIARNETGKEFAVRGMQEEAAVTTDPAAIGGEPGAGAGAGTEGGHEGHAGGGPRRGRRPEPAEKHE